MKLLNKFYKALDISSPIEKVISAIIMICFGAILINLLIRMIC